MNLYNEPAFRSEVVTQGLLGESNDIINTSGNWFKVRQWDGYESWAHGFYGVVQNEDYLFTHTFCGDQEYILDDSNSSIRSIHFGSSLIAKEHEDHYHVVLPDGIKGIINTQLVERPLNATRNSIVKTATSFTGIPYAWGGKSTLGFDCSGFVQTIFKVHGIELPRDSHQQSAHFTKEISLKECQPGDLLFFAEKDMISHVAICLGGEKLINARGWVREESLNVTDSNFSKKLKNLFVRAVSIANKIEN